MRLTSLLIAALAILIPTTGTGCSGNPDNLVNPEMVVPNFSESATPSDKGRSLQPIPSRKTNKR